VWKIDFKPARIFGNLLALRFLKIVDLNDWKKGQSRAEKNTLKSTGFFEIRKSENSILASK